MKLNYVYKVLTNFVYKVLTNNEIFGKDLIYDNIKSYKKAGLHPLPRKHIFGKSTGGWVKLSCNILFEKDLL